MPAANGGREKKRNETLRKSAADIAQCRVLKWRDDRGGRGWVRTAKTRDPDTDRPTDTHYRGRVRTERSRGASQSETEVEPTPALTHTAFRYVYLFRSNLPPPRR